jgi:endonuclease YncB( thermonuclease family)
MPVAAGKNAAANRILTCFPRCSSQPEVFFDRECYGRAASFRTKTLLLPGTRVRLFPEPVTDRVDQYGRLLRYVVRVRDGVNVNIRLVAVGAAAPYFYRRRRGRFAKRLGQR